MNKGYCQNEPTGIVKCHCQTGYWGRYCEKGISITNTCNKGCFIKIQFFSLLSVTLTQSDYKFVYNLGLNGYLKWMFMQFISF